MKLPTEPNLPGEVGALVRQLTDLHRQSALQVNQLTEGTVHAVHNAALAPPTTGKYQQGDTLRNREPTELGGAGGRYVLTGWVCTVAGEPGTWEEVRCPTEGWVGSGGSVTSVSVTTANGVSGTVATDTTTPAITLALGAITPSSVAASGAVTGSNLSGTNTGDQTITLTGAVTGSGTGSFATAIPTNSIANTQLAQINSKRFKGRTTGGVGDVEDLSVGTVQAMLGVAAPIAAMTLVGNNTGSVATAQAALTVAEVQTMLNVADSGWIAPTLLNSWTAYGGGYATPGYRKIGSTVYIRGLVTGGTLSSGTPVFVLPAGYRPTENRILMCVTAGGFTYMYVNSTGSVDINSPTGSNAFMSLDSLTFQAD